MYRLPAEILCAGFFLISAQAVFAADWDVRSTDLANSSVREIGSDEKTKDKKMVGSQEKNTIVVHGSDFRDVVLRIPGAESPVEKVRQQRPVVVESRENGSWFQMLVAGLGVALITIIRRVGII